MMAVPPIRSFAIVVRTIAGVAPFPSMYAVVPRRERVYRVANHTKAPSIWCCLAPMIPPNLGCPRRVSVTRAIRKSSS